MRLIFEQIETGGDRNFSYLLGDPSSGKAAIVDPSYAPLELIKRAEAQGLSVEWIFNTHSHHDHTNGNDTAKSRSGAKVAIYEKSRLSYDKGLVDGEEFFIGGLQLQFIHTPGHCDDHMVIYAPQYDFVLTGDHIFVGRVGKTSTEEASTMEYKSIQRLLTLLPATTTIWPGHNYGPRPSSSFLLERASNPFLQCDTLEDFLLLKELWPSYRREHGLL